MESRIRSLLLAAVGSAIAFSAPAWSQDASEAPPQVIEPNVERRDLDVAAIDTEDFEITAFVGIMSVEDLRLTWSMGHVSPITLVPLCS